MGEAPAMAALASTAAEAFKKSRRLTRFGCVDIYTSLRDISEKHIAQED